MNTAQVFDAVADGRRREILELLREQELGAGDIAARFDVSWPAISRHLKVLRQAGLVNARREGRERLYSVNRTRLRDALGGWVAAFDAMWEQNLRAIKSEVESTQKTRRNADERKP